ncbi:Resolvase, N terminal domain [Cetobacterium ceti]|uniref:Resolvase, N terminal domain n=1 Tax=Cetobacterium ceti TaxID=180163 RepID=A0A1T4K5P8_9FUSO|nr:recombinase family protein [Cetobacterium ceti]SJZ37741.1 Resolvase, N terminal domain [Cetobacterium ceti]
MKMRIYGYGRISTRNQSLKKQVEALRNYGVKEENIFTDVIIGNTRENSLEKLFEELKRGDILVVRRLDKLGSDMDIVKKRIIFLIKRKVTLKVLENQVFQKYLENLENEDSVYLEKKLEGALEILLLLKEKKNEETRELLNESNPKEKLKVDKKSLEKFKNLYEKYLEKRIRKKDILEKLEINKNGFNLYESYIK